MKIFAPFAGIIRYHVAEGQKVTTGDVLATVEAVKLEAPVPAPGPGTVTALHRENYSDVIGGEVVIEVGS
ncbi:acetyl-CoA carboxylase biotin carboxyl carrier protein subunit [Corynebacterium yudongzhengii]|uniref:Acetyl-CoA carboxylase biotin carboxyl carrier protein subunit n=1 Tax=Corynebacterium yudongzhengii TaxID=2080740 RepID=A0A2U1T970_9CORY|nr:biotin/lipoyl-containing protein [Corynebacterium yudongzhengii]AWB82028.1 acetyl-CoA carboxylase biotin carboxyl carrier protein subunit [Corynebacterium yudongzhengii]PWC02532.1 acetyl-CoA carboxylase biotin carboxyl carrier protein subunit [Corynebacterium yudongzhengii]